MNSAIYFCLICLGLSTIIQGHHLNDQTNATRSALKIYVNTAEFGTEMYKKFSEESPEKNIFFSPICISAAFSALSLGAKSHTRTQILEGLKFNPSEMQEKEIHESFHGLLSVLSHQDDQINLDTGLSLFLKDGQELLAKPLNDLHAFYNAEILPANFLEPVEAEKQINDYVQKKTKGKILELVKGLDRDTQLVIISYILFKGNWEKPFDPEHTTESDFFVNQEKTVKVPMMHRLGWFNYCYDHELSCTVLQLDYNGTATAFFVLPEQGKEKALELSLSTFTLNKWASCVSRATANVFLPKFDISVTHDLKDSLGKLGIIDVFSDQADLTGFTTQPLKVSKATHQAVLTINERGTEAAAATAVEAIPMSMPPTVKFNRPFMMMIYETSINSTLFMGKIVNPTGN